MGHKPYTAPIDQEQLAALLSGSLTGRDRQSLLARLAADEDGRILLRMALQALEAAENMDREDLPARMPARSRGKRSHPGLPAA